MERFQGIIGILVIFALIYAFSRARKHIRWRTLGVGLALQVAFALLVLKWDVGFQALIKVSEGVQKLSDFTNDGTAINYLMGTSKVEGVYASTVIFLGQAEAPLAIAPDLPKRTKSELFHLYDQSFRLGRRLHPAGLCTAGCTVGVPARSVHHERPRLPAGRQGTDAGDQEVRGGRHGEGGP